jgi:hypothetical protein
MKFYIVQTNGDLIPFEGTGMLANAVEITAAKTLTREDSGKSFVLKAAAGEAITLPDAANGLGYRFATGLAFDTSPWVITSATSTIEGSVTVNGAVAPASNENTITFVESAESLGDWVEIWSDGTSWFVSGQASLTGAITLTVV